MFIHDDLANLNLPIRWAAALRGALVAQPLFLTSGGTSGAVMAYRPATKVRRCFWISPGFQKAHPDLAELLNKCTAGSWGPCSRRKFLTSTGPRYIAFLSKSEADIIKRDSGRTAEVAAEWLTDIDIGQSATGIAKSRIS